jgi:hypothetical protein
VFVLHLEPRLSRVRYQHHLSVSLIEIGAWPGSGSGGGQFGAAWNTLFWCRMTLVVFCVPKHLPVLVTQKNQRHALCPENLNQTPVTLSGGPHRDECNRAAVVSGLIPLM